MLENIRLALRGIRTHKMRSFLTMLGIIIGIASIIAIVSIVEGTSAKLEKSLIGSGNNVLALTLSQDDMAYDFSQGEPLGVPQVSKSDLKTIQSIDGVEAVCAYQTRSNEYQSVFYGKQTMNSGTVNGIDRHYFDTMQYRISRGRTFNKEDYANGAKVAIIDSTSSDALFNGENPIGEVIEIKQEPFVVVGVVKDSNDKEEDEKYESVNDYYNQQYGSGGGEVYVPNTAWPIIYAFDEPEAVAIRVKDTEQMKSIGSQASDILNGSITNSALQYQDMNAQQSTDELNTLTNAIQLMLVAIASLSLLVGGIGVMNIMLVSVTERTSEIGLKKALGAKRKTILLQFLTESAVLTSVGGIIGVLAGLGLAKIIAYAANLEFAISVPWILIAVGFSIAIGVIFGAMPANRAAKLNPIDALRRE